MPWVAAALAWWLGLFAVGAAEGVPVPEESPEAASPFVVTVARRPGGEAKAPGLIEVGFGIPAGHHVYADSLRVEWGADRMVLQLPVSRDLQDRFSGKVRSVYEGDIRFTAMPASGAGASGAGRLRVTFQGCSESECYFPETREWEAAADGSVKAVVEGESGGSGDSAAGGEHPKVSAGFKVASRATGYLGTDQFLAFLDQEGGNPALSAPAVPGDSAAAMELGLTLGAIFFGGLLLNLTPCVLPMIPVNLAILGVGTGNRDRRRGFLLGSAYGAGMAVSYGTVGVVVVLTGARFGQLQASPWFNFAIAAVFVLLAFAMFDRWALDFSNLQGRVRGPEASRGSYLAAMSMGGVSALLAGACVAPVVISVLVLATGAYQRGDWTGLLLPFLLGLGMALPWPFAGAGLSLLPKPGAWMTRVKQTFGVVILGFAAWYGWLGWGLVGAPSGGHGVEADLRTLTSALTESRKTGRPVVIDFWASWCKNCSAMEHSTFAEARVVKRLEQVHFVRFQAEHLGDARLEPILEEFGVLGLPTYVLLVPERAGGSGLGSNVVASVPVPAVVSHSVP